MPKITRHWGPSNAAEAPALVGEHGPEPVTVVGGELGNKSTEVASSAGISSSTSPGKPETSGEPTSSEAAKPAQTTGSRTKKARGAGSTARSVSSDPTAK